MKRVMLLACALAVFAACRASPPPANGWAIVAADPATGDVGVAGASCSEYPFDYRAVLLPKQGALAQLGVASPLQRDRLGAWLQIPQDATTALERITPLTNDPEAATRQYAIVTIHQSATQVASFTGAANPPFAGDKGDASLGAVAVGGGLARQQQALNDALAEFRVPAHSGLTLSDKLMRALEAGSVAGGAALCSNNGVKQTASSAFVMMARGGDPNFQVQTLGNTAAQEPNPPFLALSTTQPIGGRNAVSLLRQAYNEWRAANLAACETCTNPFAGLPQGGTLTQAPDAALTENAMWLVAGFVVVVMIATILFFALVPRRTKVPRQDINSAR